MTIPGMRFPLGCMVAVIVPCVLLVINPDRSVGGRLFATALMCAAALGGGVIGGCIVSLAYLARGSGEPFYADLPPELQRTGGFPQATIAEVQQRLAQRSVTDLPPALLSKVRAPAGGAGCARQAAAMAPRVPVAAPSPPVVHCAAISCAPQTIAESLTAPPSPPPTHPHPPPPCMATDLHREGRH